MKAIRHSAALCMAFCAALLSGCLVQSQFNVPAYISFVDGSVFLNGRPASVNAPIHYNDILETKEKSHCQVIVDGRNIISLQSDTLFVYKIKTTDGLIELKRGFLGAIIKNRKNIHSFRVSTRTVTASIRGTSLFVGVESPEKTYTCVCNGRIHFHPELHGEERTVAAVHHDGLYFVQKENQVVAIPAGMKYHDDQMMEKMAASIGATIDWTALPAGEE